MVSHRLAHRAATSSSGNGHTPDRATYLSVLDLAGGLKAVGKTKIAEWASLRDATRQRALFQAPGGMLVVDTRKPKAPKPQAFFPTRGWPRDLRVDGDTLYLASGRYGIYEFDLTTTNLLTP
jgi:hypothetical protein